MLRTCPAAVEIGNVNSEAKLKRTPLFSAHQQLGGKLVEFGGWEMPVQYTSITDEHLAVRKAAGIFDISHMGEVLVSGAGAGAFLNATLTNDVRKLVSGSGQYSLMCNDQGGVIDDLYAYRLAPENYLLIINASRITPDTLWLRQRSQAFASASALKVEDVSEATGAVAVQGPKVAEFITACFSGSSEAGMEAVVPIDLKKNQIASFRLKASNSPVWVARTGYTGEDGFEIVAPAETIVAVWNALLQAGTPHGLKPAGLGARDTLRTEMCYPLFGHELDEQTTPIEAGLSYFVALEKGDFVGRSALSEQKSRGPTRRLAAFRMVERAAPPRPGYPVWSVGAEGVRIGQVTSGTQSPSLNVGVGMAFVAPDFAKPDTGIQIEARGRKAAAVVVRKPIYSRKA